MGEKIKKGILYTCLVLLAFVCLLPFYLMMINSTRSGVEIVTSFSIFPGKSIGENWKVIKNYFNLFQGMKNSLFIAVLVTILAGYFSSITAYALAMYKFKGRGIIFGVILIFMMIPAQLSLIGFYNLVSALKLINSYIPLIVPAIASPGIVFFLKQYLESVLSPSLLEAARIDGAGELYIFHRIVFPIMMPGVATMSIGTFIGSWNNYLLPLVLLTKTEKFTLPVLVASLKSSTDIVANQGATYLSVAISVIPIIIAFIFFSRYIIDSTGAGAVKE